MKHVHKYSAAIKLKPISTTNAFNKIFSYKTLVALSFSTTSFVPAGNVATAQPS